MYFVRATLSQAAGGQLRSVLDVESLLNSVSEEISATYSLLFISFSNLMFDFFVFNIHTPELYTQTLSLGARLHYSVLRLYVA